MKQNGLSELRRCGDFSNLAGEDFVFSGKPITTIRNVLLVLGVLMLSGCGDSDRPPLKTPDPIPVATVACRQANAVFSTAGSVVADTRTSVASRFSAYVRAVHFKEGDAVKKGDVLVELDNRDIEAAKSAALGKVTAARAAAKDAAEDFEKYSALYKDGLISNNQWRKVTLKNEGAKSDLKQAEAALSVAQTQSDYLTIRAEKDAHVAALMKHEGDLTLPGLPILMLDADAGPRFEFHVPEGARDRLQVGMPVTVTVDGLVPLSARIERLNTSSDRVSRSYLARAVFDGHPAVRPGQFGRVTAVLQKGVRPAVPRTALTERGGLTGVFVAENGRALFHWVKLGSETDDVVEILAGLTGSERLINQPAPLLYDGAPIQPEAAK